MIIQDEPEDCETILPSGSAGFFSQTHRSKRGSIDVKKEDTSFGPPLHMRLSPEELEHSAREQGFEKTKQLDLGYNFMMQFAAGKDIR